MLPNGISVGRSVCERHVFARALVLPIAGVDIKGLGLNAHADGSILQELLTGQSKPCAAHLNKDSPCYGQVRPSPASAPHLIAWRRSHLHGSSLAQKTSCKLTTYSIRITGPCESLFSKNSYTHCITMLSAAPLAHMKSFSFASAPPKIQEPQNPSLISQGSNIAALRPTLFEPQYK